MKRMRPLTKTSSCRVAANKRTRLDVPVLVSQSFEKLPELERAIDVVNREQDYFHLSALVADWIHVGGKKKWIDQYQLFAEVEKRFANVPVCVIVQNPLKMDLFCDYKTNIYVLSTADWIEKYAPPPLEIYLIYMLACGLIDLACELPEDTVGWDSHEPPIGCIYDYCSDKATAKFSMSKAFICAPCKKALARYGLTKQVLKATEQILAYVKRAMLPYYSAAPHDAFICHSSADNKFARRLANDLAASGLKVWYDEYELLPGSFFYQEIRQVIHKSAWFLLLLSPASMQSAWCKRELRHARKTELERNRGYVIPVMYKPCSLSRLLEEQTHVDCRGSKYYDGLDLILKRLRKK